MRRLRIGAQRYLERFYGDFGFVRASDEYDEDGIPHIEHLQRNARDLRVEDRVIGLKAGEVVLDCASNALTQTQLDDLYE